MNNTIYKDINVDDINEPNITFYKYLITDIRSDILHNKILTGIYFENIFQDLIKQNILL